VPAVPPLGRSVTVSVTLVAAELVVAQQHRPPAGAHFFLLAGIVVAAIAVLGVRWWRRRHRGVEAERKPNSQDRSPEGTRSREEQPPPRQP
jgi:hypothetical protein